MAEQQISKMAEERKPSSLINLLHIALDTYDDIFSDFDPSPFDHRVLSEDFMKEIQRRYAENKRGEIDVRFSIPAVMRSSKVENIIRKRLKGYFQVQIAELDIEISKRKRTGLIYFVVGFLVLLLTGYSAEIFPNSHSITVTSILLTPIGWFGMWEGVGLFVQAPQKFEEQKKFFVKFSGASYKFMNEEDYLRELAEAEGADVAKAEAQAQKKQ